MHTKRFNTFFKRCVQFRVGAFQRLPNISSLRREGKVNLRYGCKLKMSKGKGSILTILYKSFKNVRTFWT